MPNLLLTNGCNRQCPYCFASDNNVKGKMQSLSFEDLKYVSNLLIESGNRQINLLGGEPTIHPEFNKFIKYLLHLGFNIGVFTNGMISQKKVDMIKTVLEESVRGNLTFIVNINEGKYRTSNETMMERYFFKQLNKWTRLGFNIFETSWKPEFLIETILEFKLLKPIRLGLAAPVSSMTDTAFAQIKDYRKLYELILELSERGYPHGIPVFLDCAFPLCGFTEAELGLLFKRGANLKFICEIPLDIGTDLSVWNCFPLSTQHVKSLKDFKTLPEIHKFYHEVFGESRSKGVYQECDECPHMVSGACGGGCMAHYLSKERHEKPHFPFYGTDINPEIPQVPRVGKGIEELNIESKDEFNAISD